MKYYNTLNSYLRSIFQHRIHKIIIDTGLSCPNRNGVLGIDGCIYCNNRGSGSNLSKKNMTIKNQININIKKITKRFNTNKFIAYFQSFSNTYTTISYLEQFCFEALSLKNIVGVAISTRPDCIDISKLDLLEYYAQKYLVWLEYGLQSIHNKTLDLLNRNHTINSFLKAVRLTKKRKIKTCAHIILGLPYENRNLMLKSADLLSIIKIDSIKIHLFYIEKNTFINIIYKNKNYKCLSQSEYISILCSFLERLSPTIIVERLNSDPNPKTLIAPIWTLNKRTTLLFFKNLLQKRNTWQGKQLKKNFNENNFNY